MTKPDLSLAEGSSGLKVENLRKAYRKRVVIRDFSMELNHLEQFSKGREQFWLAGAMATK